MSPKSKGKEKIIINEELKIEGLEDIEAAIAKAISRTTKNAERKRSL